MNIKECLNVLLVSLPLLLPASVSAHQVQEQCWLPGMVQVSTAGPQPTANVTICTDLPPHIKPLPFGTKLRVCYERCTTVRINDRGPYIGYRELDLSYGAAKEDY